MLEAVEKERSADGRGGSDDGVRALVAGSTAEIEQRLEEMRERATGVVFANEEGVRGLRALEAAFKEVREARGEYRAVGMCRGIAEAYGNVLRGLASGKVVGVVDAVAALIGKVDDVRRMGKRDLFGEDGATNSRILIAVENRAVDAVIKVRAAFVNVLDNEFREFGWPMKVPVPDVDVDVVRAVDLYVGQLSELQKAASTADFIPQRTRWHSALSDSWAIAAILRAPLARFKYHFLESLRLRAGDADAAAHREATSRFDRPEWAADFALARIREASPFLRQIAIDGPRAADVKFAEGFCRVFAEKIAYDCELAMRASKNDSDADVLISHAADTAKQFDMKLRSGVIQVDHTPNDGSSQPDDGSPSFLSCLHMLSLNDSFMTSWASSELRLAEAAVNSMLAKLLAAKPVAESSGVLAADSADSRADMEQVCNDIIDQVGEAGSGCWNLESPDRVATFLKLTELPLLQALRATLRQEIEGCDWSPQTAEQLRICSRAAMIAQLLCDALEDRACTAFYVKYEAQHVRGLYEDEMKRLRSFSSKTCTALSNTISQAFIDDMGVLYMDQARFGEIEAPDAAVVLTHDLSEPLCVAMTKLEEALSAVARGVPCRKLASTIWLPVAERLDNVFFGDVVLQCFAGGSRNAVSAASAANSYLTATSAAKMARQVAYDAETLVSTFSVVTSRPLNFLPLCTECGPLLRLASAKVMLPSVAARQEQEEVLQALFALTSATDEEEEEQTAIAQQALQSRLGTTHVSPREAVELLAIGGLREAISLA